MQPIALKQCDRRLRALLTSGFARRGAQATIAAGLFD